MNADQGMGPECQSLHPKVRQGCTSKVTPISAHPREKRAWTGPGWDGLGCGGMNGEGVGRDCQNRRNCQNR